MSDSDSEKLSPAVEASREQILAQVSSDDELSDLDEEQFKDDVVPIDEEVYKIQRHKKESQATGEAGTTKLKSRPKSRQRNSPENGEAVTKSRQRRPKRPARATETTDARGDSPEGEASDPETRQRREIERRMDDALKSTTKRRKMDEDDIEQMQDDRISQLREQMRQAAIADAECIRNELPATNKLQLLPQVNLILQKNNLADSILDNNLLEAIRMWLEPLPDASLPAYEIQKELFAAIDRLPIKTIHLRESGLGKVVLFYQRSKRPQPAIKRLADKLVGNWTRPIMGRSDNYRDKVIATRDYNPDASAVPKRSLNTSSQPTSLAEESAIRRNRAHIPTAEAVSYQVAPRSFLSSQSGPKGDDQFRRIKQKMNVKAVKGRKSGVSIEGKELR